MTDTIKIKEYSCGFITDKGLFDAELKLFLEAKEFIDNHVKEVQEFSKNYMRITL